MVYLANAAMQCIFVGLHWEAAKLRQTMAKERDNINEEDQIFL
jgi:hypothetical protein